MLEKIIWNLEQLKAIQLKAIHEAEVENSLDNHYWLRKHNEAKEKLTQVESKLGIYLKMLPSVPERESVLFLDELKSSPEVSKACSDILSSFIEEKPKKVAKPKKEKLVKVEDVAKSIKKKLGYKKPATKKKISVSKQ
jgi:hypothetical protein